MIPLSIGTGDDAAAPDAKVLDGSAFGVRFVSYNNIARFDAHIDASDPGLIVWPGGALAESRPDRYGLEYPTLSNPDIDRPGLDEMMAYAVSRDAALSVTLPTVRYVDRGEDLANDLQGFLGQLLGGGLGPLPRELILEIGSEYYAHFQDGDTSAAVQYSAIADQMISEIALAMNDPSVNPNGAEVTIAVQAGKTLADDTEIRGELSDLSLSNVDMIVHHRFAPQPQGIDARLDEVAQIVGAWEQDVSLAGGGEPELFVSAWNVAQLTRSDALDDFLDLNPSLAPDDIDVEGRTTTEFEEFWQQSLTGHFFGARHPGQILETFASYAEAGMSAGAVFGTDVTHPGRLSWRDDAQVDHTFVGGEMVRMIYEALEGTRALKSDGPYDPDAAFTPYVFEGADRLVVFLAAGATAPGDIELDVEGLGTDLVSLWAESLTAVEDPDWMATFGIPDNPEVDETPEATTYALGERSAATVDLGQSSLVVTLAAHEVLRLVFAKTEDGADALQAISSGDEHDLVALAAGDGASPEPLADDTDTSLDAEAEPFDVAADDGLGGIGLLAFLLPLLLLL